MQKFPLRALTAASRRMTLALCLLAGFACETSTVQPGPVSRVVITDSPFPYQWIARVDVYVVSVAVSVSPDTSSGGNFVTIATPNRRVNLFALTKGITEELGAATLPTGVITAVRMVIDTDSSSMTTVNGFEITGTTGSPSIQWQSSAGRPTLNALIHEQITVPDTGALIVIDFDVGKTFLLNRFINPGSPDSGFVFSPVLRAADARRTGSIRGTVRALSATGAPLRHVNVRLYLGDPAQSEDTWSELGTAGTDASGEFVISFVTPSAHWATVPAQAGKAYQVVAEPYPGSIHGRQVIQNVAVTAGQETNLGAVILP